MILLSTLSEQQLVALFQELSTIPQLVPSLIEAIEQGTIRDNFFPEHTDSPFVALLQNVEPGQTHQTSPLLHDLHTLLQYYHPDHESVFSPQEYRDLMHECAYMRTEEPRFATILIEAIEDGRIDGSCFVNFSSYECGCAYGHLGGLDYDRADFLAKRIRLKMNKDEWKRTPMEEALEDIGEGATYEDDSLLDALHRMLLLFVPAPKEEAHGDR